VKNILIIGANSAMAEEVAKLYAVENANFFLVARNLSKLEVIQQDLLIRGANSVHISSFDANNFESHEVLINESFETLGKVDVFLIAYGSLPDQSLCETDVATTITEINTNALSVISLLTLAATRMEHQQSGNITVITSVAGDRGRQSNYIYGAAKAMLSTFLQGLAQKLCKSGIHVLDIKPGFVDTPMTAEFDKNIIWAKPTKIAQIIKKRIAHKSTFSYAPNFWFVIMTIIKFIPQSIFNKLKL
jgi:short-subunit dehydrogenase